MKTPAILIGQFLLLTVCPVLAQSGYRVTYTLQGKDVGQSVLTCIGKESVYANLPRANGQGSGSSPSNEVIAEAMKRVETGTPASQNKAIVLVHPIGTDKVLYVEEDTPYNFTVEDEIASDWKIVEEFRQIGNYCCQKATAQYKGRQYVVWFTKAIPCSAGPWKLAGLPGLILEATSADQQYKFLYASCIPIKLNSEKVAGKLTSPKLTYQQYLVKYNAYYQSQVNKIYKETSSGFMQRFGVVKVTPVTMNVENIDKSLEKRFVSDVK